MSTLSKDQRAALPVPEEAAADAVRYPRVEVRGEVRQEARVRASHVRPCLPLRGVPSVPAQRGAEVPLRQEHLQATMHPGHPHLRRHLREVATLRETHLHREVPQGRMRGLRAGGDESMQVRGQEKRGKNRAFFCRIRQFYKNLFKFPGPLHEGVHLRPEVQAAA